MSDMTLRERAARAIGYLEGMSCVLWSLDRSDSPIQVCCEQAAFYDQMVDELRKAVFGDEAVSDDDR